MSWTRLDDAWTDQAAFDGVPHDARWHYLALIQWCSRTGRYDGVVRASDARRCSDVDDPGAALAALAARGLVEQLDDAVRVVRIAEHVPPPHLRDEARKSAQAERKRRERAHRRGDHSGCRPDRCPQAVTRDVGTGRDGETVVLPSPPPPTHVTRAVTRDQRDAEQPSSDLLMVVVGALPDDLGQQLDRRTLRGVCHELAGRGWTPDALTAAAGARSWSGAGPGAVVAWLRGLDQPTPARRPQPRGARCPAGSPIAKDGSCCGTRHEEGAA